MPVRERIPGSSPQVSARIASLIALHMQMSGVSPHSILQEAGLSQLLLQDADARIPLHVEDRLWQQAAQACGDSLFGLHAAQGVRAGRLDVLDYVVRTALNLLESLQRLTRYSRLLHDVAGFALVPRGSHVRVEHRLGEPAGAASPHGAEFTLASLFVVGRQLLPQLKVVGVEFVTRLSAPPLNTKGCSGPPRRFALG